MSAYPDGQKKPDEGPDLCRHGLAFCEQCAYDKGFSDGTKATSLAKIATILESIDKSLSALLHGEQRIDVNVQNAVEVYTDVDRPIGTYERRS